MKRVFTTSALVKNLITANDHLTDNDKPVMFGNLYVFHFVNQHWKLATSCPWIKLANRGDSCWRHCLHFCSFAHVCVQKEINTRNKWHQEAKELAKLNAWWNSSCNVLQKTARSTHKMICILLPSGLDHPSICFSNCLTHLVDSIEFLTVQLSKWKRYQNKANLWILGLINITGWNRRFLLPASWTLIHRYLCFWISSAHW